MDTKDKQKLSIHRCRFVDFTPSAISALAFPPLPLPRLRKGRVIFDSGAETATGSSSKGRKFGTLAVGRANGNIELYEWSRMEHHIKSAQSWALWKILYGPNPSKVDSLAFALRNPYLLKTNEVPSISDLRLFSAGGGSELVEWDLERGTVLRTISSQGGSIWSLSVNASSTLLALGCEDGSVRLLSIELGELAHLRKFDRAKCRVMSIAWGPPKPPRSNVGVKGKTASEEEDSDDDDDEWTDEWLVTGGSDSSLRKWDVKTGRVVDKMITDKLKKQATLVWAVTVLADGTIVSGDSMGDVTFWDSMTCTQISTFRAHGADVLCLAVSPDGESVLSSGVDQKTSLFSLVHLSATTAAPTITSSRVRTRWVHSVSRRMHAHDVRALAMWPPYSPILLPSSRPPPRLNPTIAPVLASGGLDMCVTLSPCASPSAVGKISQSDAGKVVNPLASSSVPTFEDGVYRRVAYPTGLAPSISLARQANLLVSTNDDTIHIWKIRKEQHKDSEPDEIAGLKKIWGVESGYEKVLEMELETTTNICSSAVSEDGRWLAVSDVYETKLFELRDVSTSPRPKRIKSLPSLLTRHLPRGSQYPAYHGCGASALTFSPDGSKLIVAAAACGSILVVDLGYSRNELNTEDEIRVLRRFDHHRRRDAMYGGRALRPMPKGKIVNGTSASDKETGESDGESGSESGEDDGPNTSNSRSPSPKPFSSSSDAPDAPTPLITRLTISTDGQWLASTDTHRRTHIFNLDSVSHHAALPSTPRVVNALAFWSRAPTPTVSRESREAMDADMSTHASSPLLVIAMANNSLSIYDVEARRFPEWGQRVCETIPMTFRRLYDTVQGIMVDPGVNEVVSVQAEKEDGSERMEVDEEANVDSASKPTNPKTDQPSSRPSNRIYFWGSSWLCGANLTPSQSKSSTHIPTNTPDNALQLQPHQTNHSRKRRLEISKTQERHALKAMKNREANEFGGATFNLYALDNDTTQRLKNNTSVNSKGPEFNIITRYRPILFADFLSAGEVVVVERPLVDLMSSLPPAFFKAKYGT